MKYSEGELNEKEIKSPSRRLLLQGLTWVVAATSFSTINIIDQISNEKSLEEQKDPVSKASSFYLEKHKPDFELAINSWDNDAIIGIFNDVKNDIDKYSLNDELKQWILDGFVTYVFWSLILPLFLDEKASKSFVSMVATILPWYSMSNTSSQDFWRHEMASAGIWVTQMAAFVTFVESLNIDFDWYIEKETVKNYEKSTDEIMANNEISELLNKTNVIVCAPEKMNNQDIMQEDGKIWISQRIFLELLPIMKDNGLGVFVESILSYFTSKQEQEDAKQIIYDWQDKKIFFKLWNAISTDIDLHVARLIRDEIKTIYTLIFTTQIFMWVGQATLIKHRIYHLWKIIKNLSLSQWMDELSSSELESKFIMTNISYLFNRMSFYSDLWPITASIKVWNDEWIWRVNGFLSFLSWQSTAAATNIVPFINAIDEIISSTWVNDDFKQTWKKRWQKHYWIMNKILKWVVPIIKIKWFKQSDLIKNNVFTAKIQWYNKRNENEISKDNESKIEVNYKEIFDEIDDELNKSRKNNFSSFSGVSYNGLTLKSIIDVLWFFADLPDEENEKVVQILEKYKRTFLRLYDFLGHNPVKIKDEWKIMWFMKKNLDIWSKRSLNEIYKYTYERLQNPNINFESEKNSSEGLFDLDFSAYELWKQIKYGWVDGISNMLYTNIGFLLFSKNQENGWLLPGLEKNFLKNLKNEEFLVYFKRSKHKLSSLLSEEEKEYYESLIKYEEIKDDLSLPKKDELKESIKKMLDDPKAQSKIWEYFWLVVDSSDKAFSYLETSLWMNNFEMYQMIVLIQSPFVAPVSATMIRVVKSVNWIWWGIEFQKWLAWLATYILSMFADNYVWLLIGTQIMKSLWFEPKEYIEYISKFSVLWWGMVKTWNAPNAIVSKEWVGKFYNTNSISWWEIGLDKSQQIAINNLLWWLSKFLSIPAEVLTDVTLLHYTPTASDLIKWEENSVLNWVVTVAWQVLRREVFSTIEKNV